MGCGRRLDPTAGDRLARTPEGGVEVGRSVPGRGAWLCRGSPRCFEVAARRGRLARALRTALGDGEIARLRATLYGDDGTDDRTDDRTGELTGAGPAGGPGPGGSAATQGVAHAEQACDPQAGTKDDGADEEDQGLRARP